MFCIINKKSYSKNISLIFILLILFISCASNPRDISPKYVSPMLYNNYDCDQIRLEMLRVNRKLQEVMGVQSDERTKDQVALGVGLVLFWPSLFFMMGDDKEHEIAELKGEYEALEQAAIQKKCEQLLNEIEESKKTAALMGNTNTISNNESDDIDELFNNKASLVFNIVKIQGSFVLIQNVNNQTINVDDIFSVIRINRNNTKKKIGVAKVVQIKDQKIALKVSLDNPITNVISKNDLIEK
jgi:hypothetical protein